MQELFFQRSVCFQLFPEPMATFADHYLLSIYSYFIVKSRKLKAALVF